MRRFLISLGLILTATLTALAQDETLLPQVFSPDAAELGQFGKVPVSYYSGLPHIEIPLTTLQAKGHDMDISLMYHGGGIKPDMHPGWVGLGWTLNAGGCINRIINGRKDELEGAEVGYTGSNLGYLYMCSTIQAIEPDDDSTLEYLYNIETQNDLEPDEFQINVPGICASFYIVGYDTTTGECSIKIKSRNGGSFRVDRIVIARPTSHEVVLFEKNSYTTLLANLYSYIASIQITDDKGTIYRFGGNDSAIEFSYESIPGIIYNEPLKAEWNVVGTANSWMLREIEYKNGEIIRFEYKKDGIPIVVKDSHFRLTRSAYLGYGNYHVDSKNSNSCLNLNFSFIRPSYLTSVTSLVMGDSVSFSSSASGQLGYGYSENEFNKRVADIDYSNILDSDWSFNDFKSKDYYLKLDTVSCHNRRVVLNYRDSLNRRLRLQKVRFLNTVNQEVYNYDLLYDSVNLPPYNSKQTDHWGYYNGKYYGNTQYPYLDTVRTPVANLCKAESLIKIYYPTGGWTEFEYELNSWSRVADPFSQGTKIKSESGTGGGLRIKAIHEYDKNSIVSRRFSYTGPDNTSSGILNGKPLYTTSGDFSSADFHWWNNFPVHFEQYDTFGYYIASERSICQLPTTDGRTVTYDSVKELFDDGTSIIYKYTNHADSPDAADGSLYTNFDNITLINKITSGELGRGLLIEKSWKDASGSLVKKEEYSYSKDTTVFAKALNVSGLFSYNLKRLSFYKLYTYFPHLKTKTVTEYSPTGNNVVRENEYWYNGHRLLSSTKEKYHDGTSLRRNITYACDISGSSGEAMLDSNMLAFPALDICTKDMPSGLRKLISATKYNYALNSNNGDYVITDVYKALGDTYYPNPMHYHWLRSLSLSGHDALSNPGKSIGRDSLITLYGWGYGGRYMINEGCVVHGDTLSRSYSWIPLTGLSRITDERGRRITYQYDSFGRLSTVKDHDGNPLKSYSYHYDPSIDFRSFKREDTYTSAAGASSYKKKSLFDGLGRLEEEFLLDWAPAGQSDVMVSLHEYDSHARDSVIWIPSALDIDLETLPYIDPLSFKDEAMFFHNEWEAFSLKAYTADDRESWTMGPGGLWHAADKKIKKSYSCATSSGDSLSIRFFSITWAADTCAIIDELNTSSYDLSKISVVRSEDEDGRVAFEFRDIEGKLLLSRKRINSDYLDTHYLYDVHGNLEFVSPPKLSYILQGDILELSDDVISAYAWQYRYDDEGKMIARKFPGAAWEYYVYDAGGRKVLSQDGKLRSLGKWKFHVKDELGRDCVEGLCDNTGINPFSASYTTINQVIKPHKVFGVHYFHHFIIPNSVGGYKVDGLEFVNARVLSAWYWDNYRFPAHRYLNVPSSLKVENVDTTSAAGLLSGTYRAFLEGDSIRDGMAGVFVYDATGHISTYFEDNDGTYSKREDYSYDFLGNPLSVSLAETITPGDTLRETRSFTYDNAGRLLSATSSLGGGNTSLVQNTYDGIGRLLSERHGGPSGPAWTYGYNIRSDIRSISSTQFTEVYHAEDDVYNPSFTGNITASSSEDGSWHYTYDELSRLEGAEYTFPDGLDSYVYSYYFDMHGNITYSDSFSDNHGYYQLYLDHEYNFPYAVYGDFDDYCGISDYILFGYYNDANGNCSPSINSGISRMSYNILNLPASVTRESGGKAIYSYLSDGTKWSVRDSLGGNGNVVHEKIYAGDAIYVDGTLKTVRNPYGYADISSSGAPSWRFFLKDRRGNVRRVQDPSGSILQRIEYSPYGSMLAINGNTQPWRFSGNELMDETGNILYDFMARLYHPLPMRFLSIDPQGERHYDVSPYSYCAGNPINRIDPNGAVDWKMVGYGAITAASGAITLAGASSLPIVTAGPLFFIIPDAMAATGIGICLMIMGALTDPSSINEEIIDNVPKGLVDVLAKGTDAAIGEDSSVGQITADVINIISAVATKPNIIEIIQSPDASSLLYLLNFGKQVYSSTEDIVRNVQKTDSFTEPNKSSTSTEENLDFWFNRLSEELPWVPTL